VDTSIQETNRLRHISHAERIVAQANQMAGDKLRTVAVGVGFDARPQWAMADGLLQNPQVVRQAVEMNDRCRQMAGESERFRFFQTSSWRPCRHGS
jgi:hypothetical protein